jgi:DNA-binding response OmpR family regulator
MLNILLVDDESIFFEMLSDKKSNKYRFFYVSDPKTAASAIEKNKIDLVLMDWNLKDESGLDYVKQLRCHHLYSKIPIIMLTGNVENASIVQGLNSGANDYVTKPFNFDVLSARIDALLRKNTANTPIELNQETFEITLSGTKIRLRKKEFMIMKILLENPDRTFTRDDLNNLTSGEDIFVGRRSIDTFVRYLRKKLPCPTVIETIRGKGYKININNF